MAGNRRGRVTISPEVEALVRSSGLDPRSDRLAGGSEFRCLVCQVDGNVGRGEDASLVLVRYRETGNMLLRFAHSSCSPSQILDFEGAGELRPPADVDVRTLTACLPGPDGQLLSILLIDRSDPSGAFTPGGDFLDPWLQTLLHDGWELVAPDADQLPDLVNGYAISLDPAAAQAEIASPRGLLLDQLGADVPPQWFDIAARAGYVWIFTGELHLDLIEAMTLPAIMTCMQSASARGALVTARVAVSYDPPDPARQAAATLAGLFDGIVHSTRPGDGNRFDKLSPLVEHPVTPRLLVADFAGTPTLLLDINDEDDQQARRTFKAFERAGLAVVIRDKMWKAMPDGWWALLWPTQALILAPPAAGGDRRKVLFAEYENRSQGLTWYREAMTYPAPSVFLMVTNLKGSDLTGRVIANRIDRGRVLGGAILSMGTIEC